MTLTLRPDCDSALKHALTALQQKILHSLAKWPSIKGQSTPEYSKALCSAINGKKRHRQADLQALAAARGGLCLEKHYTTMNDKVTWQCNALRDIGDNAQRVSFNLGAGVPTVPVKPIPLKIASCKSNNSPVN
ncbi:hypothetical protein [Gilliamella sp. B2838]|uniref:hypothetical protein n=1 Tax=Gilliamella sp. B2838 TaxID=2818020 RepID=UPI0022698C2B|nr:hypothetical protein [Gilliamella sp. B2838]MCX8726445.1 hypothetical protein [Gilliamella sp. B2838]